MSENNTLTALVTAEQRGLYTVRLEGRELPAEGYCYRNCLASYIHLHFGSNPAIAPAFVDACKAYRAIYGNGSVS